MITSINQRKNSIYSISIIFVQIRKNNVWTIIGCWFWHYFQATSTWKIWIVISHSHTTGRSITNVLRRDQRWTKHGAVSHPYTADFPGGTAMNTKVSELITLTTLVHPVVIMVWVPASNVTIQKREVKRSFPQGEGCSGYNFKNGFFKQSQSCFAGKMARPLLVNGKSSIFDH